jgi:hypothetical protein
VLTPSDGQVARPLRIEYEGVNAGILALIYFQ